LPLARNSTAAGPSYWTDRQGIGACYWRLLVTPLVLLVLNPTLRPRLTSPVSGDSTGTFGFQGLPGEAGSPGRRSLERAESPSRPASRHPPPADPQSPSRLTSPSSSHPTAAVSCFLVIIPFARLVDASLTTRHDRRLPQDNLCAQWVHLDSPPCLALADRSLNAHATPIASCGQVTAPTHILVGCTTAPALRSRRPSCLSATLAPYVLIWTEQTRKLPRPAVRRAPSLVSRRAAVGGRPSRGRRSRLTASNPRTASAIRTQRRRNPHLSLASRVIFLF